MNNFTFTEKGWEHYLYWQTQDRKTLKKVNALIEDIKRNGVMQGIGKPEPLKHKKSGLYKIDELQNIEIISCKGHYED